MGVDPRVELGARSGKRLIVVALAVCIEFGASEARSVATADAPTSPFGTNCSGVIPEHWRKSGWGPTGPSASFIGDHGIVAVCPSAKWTVRELSAESLPS
jgi:hypothetical protein